MFGWFSLYFYPSVLASSSVLVSRFVPGVRQCDSPFHLLLMRHSLPFFSRKEPLFLSPLICLFSNLYQDRLLDVHPKLSPSLTIIYFVAQIIPVLTAEAPSEQLLVLSTSCTNAENPFFGGGGFHDAAD